MAGLNVVVRSKITLSTAIFAVGIILYKVVHKLTHPLPPGPRGWPLVGCINILTPDMYYKFVQLGKKYGSVFSFYLGNRLTVVLNDYKAIRAAFVDQSVTFAGRPYPWVLHCVDVVEEINNGTYTEEWIEKKKFVLSAMRKFGYGAGSGLDVKIETEIHKLTEIYHKKQMEEFDPKDHLNRAMANLIFSILSNESYDYDAPELQEKLDVIAKWQGTVGEANILDLFPTLRFLPFQPIKRLREVAKDMKAVYGRQVTLHKTTFDPGNLRDVIDVFLKEKGVDYDSQKLIGLFVGLSGDAADSLPEVMRWLVLYLTHHPHIQTSIQREVDAIGLPVCAAHRPLLPYTEAFVLEGLRLSTFVVLSEPHTTLSDSTLNGYHIPRGSLVLANIYAAHMDDAFWGDPQNFRPEHFLDSSGKLDRKEAFMAFSVGRRTCIGEQLSMKVCVLYVASLMQSFHLSFPAHQGSPGLLPPQGYNRKPLPFSVMATPRV